METLKICPSTLASGYDTYSPIARKRLFDGKNISPFLPYNPIEERKEETELFLKNQEHMSLSGVQTKYSVYIN